MGRYFLYGLAVIVVAWVICALVLTKDVQAQIFRFARVDLIPVSGVAGRVCFDELTVGQRFCFVGPSSLIADININVPTTAGTAGDCLGLSSAGQLGWLTCSGGGSSFTLNGLTAASQTFSFTNDTNVLLSVTPSGSNHQFVVTWSGALSKARQFASTVYTDQNNIFSVGFLQDFGAASMKIPTGASLFQNTLGHITFDSTTLKMHVGRGSDNRSLVQGPNATTPNNVPVYLDTAGRELGVGYGATSLITANTLALRGSNSEALIRDNGAQVYNVKAFGAIGNGVANDTAAILLARDAAEVAGGVVFIPGGKYCTHASVIAGNGNSGADNTKPPIIFQGVGAALHSSTPQASTFVWCGGNQGSKTPMIQFAGPYGGGSIRDLTLEAGNFTNVVGIDGQQWGQGTIENVSITGVNNGDALKYHHVRVSGIQATHNIVKGLVINSPGTNGNGVYLTGGSTEPMKNAASNVFVGGSWWGSEYALKLENASGNLFDIGALQVGGGTNGTNCALKFVRSTVDTNFPQGNFFRAAEIQGYCGTTGLGSIPNAFIPLGECDYTTYCNPKLAITSGTPVFQLSFPNLSNAFRGLYGMEARGDSATTTDPVFFFDNVNGSHTYTGAIAHSKGGVVYATTVTHRNDGHVFMSKSSDGAGSLTTQGYLSTWAEFYQRPIARADLAGYNPPRGARVHCDGCANDSTCSASAGNSAIALRVNTSGSFPTGWRCD